MISISKETCTSTVVTINHIKNEDFAGYIENFWMRLYEENPYLTEMLLRNATWNFKKPEESFLMGAFLMYLAINREMESRELEDMLG